MRVPFVEEEWDPVKNLEDFKEVERDCEERYRESKERHSKLWGGNRWRYRLEELREEEEEEEEGNERKRGFGGKRA